jgi:phage terminase large subunit GpA-like protein
MISEQTSGVFSDALQIAIPEPGLTVSRWADNYRMVSERSARPGRWRTDLVPYTREIMDAASDPTVREIVFVKPRQCGGTESVLNIIGYFIHIEPTTQLYCAEVEQKAEAWSSEKLAPMIRDTEVLSGLVRDSRMRDANNTIRAKAFPGGHLAVAYATSPDTGTSRACRVIYFDERDAYRKTKAGDFVTNTQKAASTFPNKLFVKVSTPGDRLENPPGTALDAPRYSPIEREYQDSDRRKYWVPCPHCGTFQTLKWAQVRWDDEPLLAYYLCEAETCGERIEEEDKPAMVAAGEWRAEAEFRGVAGFHLNMLYSPFVTMGEVAEEFLAAKRSGDIQQMKVWVTMCLAEGWQDPEENVSTSTLEDRREDYAGDDGAIPVGVCLVTAGVDLQSESTDPRLESELAGWGLNGESWSLDYVVVHGDPARPQVWEKVKQEVLNRGFTRVDGVKLRVECTTVDSGDGGYANEVYRFTHANRGYRCFAVKGSSTAGRPLVGKPSVVGRPPVKLFLLGTEAAKDTFIANLRIEEQGPGYCHFPMERQLEQGRKIYDEDHFKQLLSERPKLHKGKRVWRKIREAARNEALDARVYAMAAYAILNPDMIKLHKYLSAKADQLAHERSVPEVKPETAPDTGDAPPASPRVPSAGPRTRGFSIPRRGRGR